MGALKDFFDIIKDGDAMKEIRGALKMNRGKSLSERSLEGTLQFPVIISRSMDINVAQVISKALERNFTTFVQTVFTMNPFLHEKDGRAAKDYLGKFHQNIVRSKSNIFSENLEINLESAEFKTSIRTLTAKNKEELDSLYEYLNMNVLNNRFRVQDIKVLESKALYESQKLKKDKERVDAFNTFIDKKTDDKDSLSLNNKTEIDNAESRDGRNDLMSQRLAFDTDNKAAKILVNNGTLKDNDIKKANELIASTLTIKVVLVNDNGPIGTLQFIVGVKAVLHPVTSEEMVRNLVQCCKNNNKVFNFFRWTTGEISFFKDLMLSIDTLKNDVVNSEGTQSPWWNILKRRKRLTKLPSFFKKNNLIPNATLVTTKEEIEKIKIEYGFDLKSDVFLDKIMKEYFLVAFVIVDMSSQTVEFKYEGHATFETVTIGGLEKVGPGENHKVKEMLRVLNK